MLPGSVGPESQLRQPCNPYSYRLKLAVFPLTVPPLRERREDIAVLTPTSCGHARRMERNIESIPTYALQVLADYYWPGNIHELQNLER